MRSLIKSKKGQGANYLAVVIVLMVFGFFSILAYTVWAEVVTAFTAGGYNTGIVNTAIDGFTNGFAAADYVMVLLMIFLVIGVGITSFKVSTRSIGFIITIIAAIFWGLISYFFNFVFIQLVSPEVFSVTIGVFPRTLAICTNLHWIVLVQIIIGSLTLYGKQEKGQFLT